MPQHFPPAILGTWHGPNRAPLSVLIFHVAQRRNERGRFRSGSDFTFQNFLAAPRIGISHLQEREMRYLTRSRQLPHVCSAFQAQEYSPHLERVSQVGQEPQGRFSVFHDKFNLGGRELTRATSTCHYSGTNGRIIGRQTLNTPAT